MCAAQCGSMGAKALSFVLRAAGSEHHMSSTRRMFTYVVGGRVGMNDTCYFTLDMKKLDLPHTFPSPSYRPGLSLWQVPPISFSLSLIGPACHCGRSRLSPLSIFFTFLPLSLSYRPGLSLWQVPPFLSPFLPSSPSSPFHFPLFYRPGLSLWQVPPIFDFTSII